MPHNLVDLTGLKFWGMALLAVALLTPLTDGRLRKWAWAAVNLLFLLTLLGPQPWAAAILGLIAIYALLRGLEGGAWRIAAALLLGGGTAILFAIHKVPAWAGESSLATTNSLLAAVGYSYLALRIVDVLRAVFERRHPAPDFASAVNYLVPFHMLAAGPIQAYDEFVGQPAMAPALTTREVLDAVQQVVWGLVKKFVLAYSLKSVFLTDFRMQGWYLLWEAQVFFVFLYLDFSAFSDIALGLGKLMGVATPENFRRPYLARNLIRFWESWHITLSQFIRRHIFVPVQLFIMRRTNGRFPFGSAVVAIAVSFLCVGMWHRISIPFVVWGILQGAGVLANNLFRKWLIRRLGSNGHKRYLANHYLEALAIGLTFEYVALSLACVMYPWSEIWP